MYKILSIIFLLNLVNFWCNKQPNRDTYNYQKTERIVLGGCILWTADWKNGIAKSCQLFLV